MGIAAAEHCAERQVQYPRHGIARLRQRIATENVGRAKFSPKLGQNLGCDGELVAPYSERSAVYRSRRGAPDDRERVALRLDAADFANTLQDARLIRATGATTRHHQAERVLHGSDF